MKTYKALVGKFFSEPAPLLSVLKKLSQESEAFLREAALKGAVWVQERGKGKILRERSADRKLNPQDLVYFYVDKKVLTLPIPKNILPLYENSHYGVWIKPAGVLPQGTQTGDHTSLLRHVEQKIKKEAFLIHRIDRETEGLMIIGYSSKAAAELSRLFQENKVQKIYEAVVLGELEVGLKRTINLPLDDKEAITHFEVLKAWEGKSLIRVELETGRLHQIRRHLDFIGHPIMGDPKYGKNNKNRDGLKLLAYSLSFIDPWTKKEQYWELGQHLTV